MTPFVAYHASWNRHRDSIAKRGLLPNQPRNGRPFGVYVFRDDGAFDHPTFSRGGRRVRWSHGQGQDTYRVGYIGPMVPDAYVENGMVLLDRAEDVTLVTGNNCD